MDWLTLDVRSYAPGESWTAHSLTEAYKKAHPMLSGFQHTHTVTHSHARTHAPIRAHAHTHARTHTGMHAARGANVRRGRSGESMSRQCRPPPIQPIFFRVQLRHLGERGGGGEGGGGWGFSQRHLLSTGHATGTGRADGAACDTMKNKQEGRGKNGE